MQVLADISDPTCPAFQESLRELRAVCGAQEMLPRSCTLPESPLTIGPPVTSGLPHEGIFDGSRVRIKLVRVDKDDPQKVKKVCYRPRHVPTFPGTNGFQIFHQVAVLWKHSAHPNIVPLLGATTTPLRFISDWMSGGNLTGYTTSHPDVDRLGLVGPPPPVATREMLTPRQLSDIAEGLNYLHSCNVVHGDLKGVRDCSESRFTAVFTPSQPNILVDATGRARITDFGLATVAKNSDSMWNASGDWGHSVRWTAPEILNEQGMYSREADVFSLAMVTIEVHCG